MKASRLLVVGLLLTAGKAIGQAMTVEEAYQAIPHQRTVFLPNEAKMSSEEVTSLSLIFSAADQAIVDKVRVGRGEPVQKIYAPLIAYQGHFHPVQKLTHVNQLIKEAAWEEMKYLEKSGSSSRVPFDRNDPLVQSASSKLQAAYGELMGLYPAEGAHNKQAFYDYLCALDFL